MKSHAQTHQKSHHTGNRSLLQSAVLANAIFSGLSGLGMLLVPGAIAELLGLTGTAAVSIMGVALLLYVPVLMAAARRSPVPKAAAWTIIGLDVLWVAGSAALVFLNPFDFTTAGRWAVAITADVVAVFALLQYLGLRRQTA